MTLADVGAALAARPLLDLLSLAGKNSIVTGAGNGIGAATVLRLAEAGATVLAADIDAAAATEIARRAQALHGGQHHGLHVDVRHGDSIRSMIASGAEIVERVDILVNNAGIFPATTLADLTDEAWDNIISVNLRSILIASRAVAPLMAADGRGGVIISTSSTAGFRAGGQAKSHYVATKHGVRGLTKGLAVELGKSGIRVLDVAPTLTHTPGVEQVLGAEDHSRVADRLSVMAGTLPIGRTAHPDDIARVITVCASDLAAMMTGSTIAVDGGHLAL